LIQKLISGLELVPVLFHVFISQDASKFWIFIFFPFQITRKKCKQKCSHNRNYYIYYKNSYITRIEHMHVNLLAEQIYAVLRWYYLTKWRHNIDMKNLTIWRLTNVNSWRSVTTQMISFTITNSRCSPVNLVNTETIIVHLPTAQISWCRRLLSSTAFNYLQASSH
jgi:hypothetical protein